MAQPVKHVLISKFKDSVSAAELESLIQDFHALPALISDIKSFEWGTDVSVENRHQGFTHIFVLTFESSEGRDSYLAHPEHEAFATRILAALDKLVVIDYNPSTVNCL